MNHLPEDPKARKAVPIYSGFDRYFPDAIVEVAMLSKIGNDQHNPGKPLHWSKGKSTDHDDCIRRHQLDAGKRDSDGVRHRTKVAWRAMAALQIEIEAERLGMSYETYIAELKAKDAAMEKEAAAPAGPSTERPWIQWFGETDQPPVSHDTRVEVRFRNGYIPLIKRAGFWTWKHVPAEYGGNIVAYRKADG